MGSSPVGTCRSFRGLHFYAAVEASGGFWVEDGIILTYFKEALCLLF